MGHESTAIHVTVLEEHPLGLGPKLGRKELPRDGSVFSDDAHLTERGSRMIAAAVADYLLARPPFSSP